MLLTERIAASGNENAYVMLMCKSARNETEHHSASTNVTENVVHDQLFDIDGKLTFN